MQKKTIIIAITIATVLSIIIWLVLRKGKSPTDNTNDNWDNNQGNDNWDSNQGNDNWDSNQNGIPDYIELPTNANSNSDSTTIVEGESIARIAEAIHVVTNSHFGCSAFGQPANYWLSIVSRMPINIVSVLKREWNDKWYNKNGTISIGIGPVDTGGQTSGRSIYDAVYQLVAALPDYIDCLTPAVRTAALNKLK